MARPLGQHFLTDDRYLEAIAETAVPDGGCVLEIGAGKGALTRCLARRSEKVLSVEIDTGLKEALEIGAGRLPNVEILWGDFLKVREEKTVEKLGNSFSVAGNVPYYITTDIVKKILWEYTVPERVTLLMQKEAAERLTAPFRTKDYGPLAIEIALGWTADIPIEVPPAAFMPQPHVDSAVLMLEKKKIRPENERLARVRRLTRCAFTQRRKQMPGILGAAGITKERASEALEAIGQSAKARPEELSPGEWLAFADFLSEHLE